jgi:recombination associated protein RdgC
MPALRGSLTYQRFFVEGELPDDFRERFMRSIRHRAMKPLEPDDEDLERSGWSRIGEPFELELGYEDVFYNAFVNLGFRTDRWVVPSSVMRTNLREAEQAYLQKKGRERLTRREKGELKFLVAKKLRRQTSPSTRSVDVSWSLNDGIVRFFSHAPKAAAKMTELFAKTFGVRLVPESPYTLAARLGLTKAEERVWQDLEVTLLAEEP